MTHTANNPNKLTPPSSSFSLIMALAVVAMISGFLVALVYQYTMPIIAENQRLATERAIFKVLPNATSHLTFRLKQNGLELVSDSAKDVLFYVGYDSQHNFVGVALNAAGQGYQDTVKLLYGYHPITGCITGFAVLKSAETPGFGTKINTDEAFLANFNCLVASVNPSQNGLTHIIKTVRHGTKKNAWHIDAISGATITSNAVGRMLNKSGQALHPIIAKHLTFLKSAQVTNRGNHDKPN